MVKKTRRFQPVMRVNRNRDRRGSPRGYGLFPLPMPIREPVPASVLYGAGGAPTLIAQGQARAAPR